MAAKRKAAKRARKVAKKAPAKRTRKRVAGSLRERAEHFGVSPEAIRNWKAAGVDVMDEAAVAEFRKGLVGEDRAAEPKDLQEARRLKVIAETRLAELKIAETERKLVPIAEVDNGFVAVGVIVRQVILRLENDLPPMLEGLKAAGMKKILRTYLRDRLREMADFSAEQYEKIKEGDEG